MPDGDVFDYVIVGAGSAGCLLAERLTQDPRVSVCVLESGPPDRGLLMRVPAGYMKTLADPAVTWRLRAEPTPAVQGRGILVRQGRVVGGTSSVNGMVYVRGQAADYDGWAAAGNPGWDHAGVLPFFKSVERFMGARKADHRGLDGDLGVTDNDWTTALSDAFIAAAVATGIPRQHDYNGASQEGVGYYERTIGHGRRNSAASAFLRKAERRANLELRTSSRAARILLDGRRAKGVAYLREADRAPGVVLARREVIVSAGTANTPKLLQLSGIGPRDVLAGLGIEPVHVLPGVGENFRDHFSVRVIARVRPARTVNELGRGLPLLGEIGKWLLGRPGILTISPALIYIFARSSPEAARPDVQGFFTPGSFVPGRDELEPEPGITCGAYVMRPESTGHIRARTSDPFDDPILQPNYLSAETDRRLLVEAVRLVRRVYAAEPLRAFIKAELTPGPDVASDEDILAFARATGVTSHHLIGSARMGPAGDPTAVVDSALRVHGIDALRVVDASVMPSMPSGNTLAPTLMIAEKAAAAIREAAGR